MPESTPAWLVIRADAGPRVGVGHVMRCLALAQAWKRAGGRAVFVGRIASEGLTRKLAAESMALVVPADNDPDGLTALLAVLAAKTGAPGASWCVLDGYGFGPGFQAAVRRDGRRLLVLDDQAHFSCYHADAVLNQNPHAPGLAYDSDPGATLLLGCEFALLREEFLNLPQPTRPAPPQVRRVLVTMGGADPDNVTAVVLAALAAVGDPGLEVTLVAGPANRHAQSLVSALAVAPLIGRLLIDPANLPEMMVASDFVISAGGSTCLELCFLGVPLAVTVLANNQASGAAALAQAGAALPLGPAQDLSIPETAAALRAVFSDASRRAAMAKTGARLVDGQGAGRVVARLLALSGQSLRLRPALAEDAALLLAWRNDPGTVKASHTARTVASEEHQDWLRASLENPSRRLYVAEVDGRPAGMVRVDRDAAGSLLSWAVDPAYRGGGIGKAMVRLAAKAICGPVRAEVKADNSASIRIAEHAGLVLDRELDGVRYYTRAARQD